MIDPDPKAKILTAGLDHMLSDERADQAHNADIALHQSKALGIGSSASPYALLNIAPRSKPSDVRAAYLRLAKKYHPDVNPNDAEAERRFKQVNEAYRLVVARRMLDKQASRHRHAAVTPWAASVAIVLAALATPILMADWLTAPLSRQPSKESRIIAQPLLSDAAAVVAAIGAQPAQQELESSTSFSKNSGPSVQQDSALFETRENLDSRIPTAGYVQLPLAPAAAPPMPELEPHEATRLARLFDEERLQADLRAWQTAQDVGTLISFEDYVKNYPAGHFINQAERRLALLQSDMEARRRDEEAWNNALRQAKRSAFEAYLSAYPDGQYAGEARNKLATRETKASNQQNGAAKQEDKAWESAKRKATPNAFLAYLKVYPNGRYSKIARETMAQQEIKSAGKVGQSGFSEYDPFAER